VSFRSIAGSAGHDLFLRKNASAMRIAQNTKAPQSVGVEPVTLMRAAVYELAGDRVSTR